MSGRGRRIADDELVSKLQSLLPAEYIKSLQREMDDLSDRLSVLMATMDVINSPEAEIIRSLLGGS
ncbi:unnamed protein product [Musa acuminata subsp. burmannicoides]